MRQRAPTLIALTTTLGVVVAFAAYWNVGSQGPFHAPPLDLWCWVATGGAIISAVISFLGSRGRTARLLAWVLAVTHLALVSFLVLGAFWFKLSEHDPEIGDPNVTWLLLPVWTAFAAVAVAFMFALVVPWWHSRTAA